MMSSAIVTVVKKLTFISEMDCTLIISTLCFMAIALNKTGIKCRENKFVV